MPFGVPFDEDRCRREAEKALELFEKLFRKSYRQAKFEEADRKHATTDESMVIVEALTQRPQNDMLVPEQAGHMNLFVDYKKFNAARKRKHFFWVKQNFTIAYGSGPEPLVQENVLNLWGYRVSGTERKPEGNRRGGPDWVPDEDSPNCTLCNRAFSAVTWHHHCRNCGQVFCSECAANKMDMQKFGYTNPQRVCNTCWGKEKRRRPTVVLKHEEDTSHEDAEFHGIQLVHAKRPPYTLQCDSLDEKKRWMSVLKLCCMRAQKPMSTERSEAIAFQMAHRQLMWMGGAYGQWSVSGTEVEMLVQVIANRIKHAIIDPCVADADASISDKNKIRATITMNNHVFTMLSELVPERWARLRASVISDGSKESSVSTANDVESIRSSKRDAYTALSESLSQTVEPAVKDMCARLANKVLEAVVADEQSLVDVFTELFASMDACIQAITDVNDADTCNKQLQLVAERLALRHDILGSVYAALDAMRPTLQALVDNDDELLEFSVNQTIDAISNVVSVLADSVVYTIRDDELLYKANTAGPSAAKIVATWNDRVFAALLKDTHANFRRLVERTVANAVAPSVYKRIVTDVNVSKQLQNVNDTLSAESSTFINTSTLLDSMIATALRDHIATLCTDKISASCEQLAQCHMAREVTRLSIA